MAKERKIYDNITEDLIAYGDTNREKIKYPKDQHGYCQTCGNTRKVRPAWLKSHEADLDCPQCTFEAYT